MMVSKNYNYPYHLFHKTTNFVVGPTSQCHNVRLTGGTLHKSCSFLKQRYKVVGSFLKPHQKLFCETTTQIVLVLLNLPIF
jgi:hypothetical protein